MKAPCYRSIINIDHTLRLTYSPFRYARRMHPHVKKKKKKEEKLWNVRKSNKSRGVWSVEETYCIDGWEKGVLEGRPPDAAIFSGEAVIPNN